VWREDTNLPCCLTKIVEPECTEITSEVCVDHVETICALATTMECTQTSCPVEVTMPVQETNEFVPWDCQDIWVTATYTATRAIEVEETRKICDDKWCTGDDGEMFKCGEVDCKESTYTVPKSQEYEKEESVKASNCTQLPPIKYLTCQNMTTTQEQLCTTCEPRVISECKSQTRPECIESTSKTCKPQTQTECNFKALEPYQEFQPKRRCLGHGEKMAKQVKDASDIADLVDLRGEGSDSIVVDDDYIEEHYQENN
jgi:hypothetical protein